MAAWKYRTGQLSQDGLFYPHDHPDRALKFDDLADDGWELLSTYQAPDSSKQGQFVTIGVFRRPADWGLPPVLP